MRSLMEWGKYVNYSQLIGWFASFVSFTIILKSTFFFFFKHFWVPLCVKRGKKKKLDLGQGWRLFEYNIVDLSSNRKRDIDMAFLLRLTFNNIRWNKLTLSHSGRTRRTFSLCFCLDVYSMMCISSVICSTLLVSCSVFCGKAWQSHCCFYRHGSLLIHVVFSFIVKLNPSHQISQLIKALWVN